MPLVRISHASGQYPISAKAMSLGVHRALMDTFNVPADDFFQIVTEHLPSLGIVGPTAFLGVAHTANLVFVQITCAEGRTIEQKKALYAAIAENLSYEPGLRAEDVIISLVETKRENWSFGNGIAQFASQ